MKNAPGSKDYIPISVTLSPQGDLKPGKLTYPKAEMMTFGDEKVPVFDKPFRSLGELAWLLRELAERKNARAAARDCNPTLPPAS